MSKINGLEINLICIIGDSQYQKFRSISV